MIEAKNFNKTLLNLGLNFFTGVPDSTLKSWLRIIFKDREKNFTNRIVANEGLAIACASGYYLSTGKVGVVYLQNSGLGNCINPLTSLADSEVYGIPMILFIGWRGAPGKEDEPQHKKMGLITEKILSTLSIPYEVLDEKDYLSQIKIAKENATLNQHPYAFLIGPGTFSNSEEKLRKLQKINSGFIREDAIKIIVDTIDSKSRIFSTTGKTSRELYEVSEVNPRGHKNNFYNVGSMGHVGLIGLEFSIQSREELVYILDGDGALLMHLGSLASVGKYSPVNFIHIVFDNQVHESTGSQPTLSNALDIGQLMKACDYKQVRTVNNAEDLFKALQYKDSGPLGLIVNILPGSRDDLGRPKDSPKLTKNRFMNRG